MDRDFFVAFYKDCLLTSRSSDSRESAMDLEWGKGDRRERHNDEERGGRERWEDEGEGRGAKGRGGGGRAREVEGSRAGLH